MVVHFILKTVKTVCNCCKRENDCFLYKCEVDYKCNLEDSYNLGEVEKDNEEVKNCDTMIPICRSCYHSDKVFVCEKHYLNLNTNAMCDYTYQSYGHSPVDYWCVEIGIRRVYDTSCQYCGDTFYTCGRHPRSPHKKTVCASCNITKLGGRYYRHLYGLKRLTKDRFYQRKIKEKKVNEEYEKYIAELKKPDEEGFVTYISKRKKKEIKKNIAFKKSNPQV
jgi:hypothetical protein